jgi:hypothetical protein
VITGTNALTDFQPVTLACGPQTKIRSNTYFVPADFAVKILVGAAREPPFSDFQPDFSAKCDKLPR